jgi:uncharacterized protein involved in outer membrane biogenesis
VGRKLFWWVALPLVVIVGIGLSLPFILNSINYKALLVWQLETQLKRKVELGNATVDIFPHVRIQLEGITVFEPDGTALFMTADRLFVDLRIFPLLARKVVVRRVILDRPMVRITRETDGKLNISDLFTSGQGAVTVPMLGKEIKISDGRIVFTQAFQTDVVRTLTIEHLNTTVKSGLREITADLSAQIPREKGQAILTLNAKLPLQAGEGNLTKEGAGHLEVQSLDLGQLAPFLESRSLMGGRGIVDVKTEFEYHAGTGGDSLALKNLRLTADRTAVTGSAVINGILDKPGGFSAVLTTTPFRLDSLIGSLPEEMLRDHGLEFLKTSGVGGPIKLNSLRVSVNPGQEPPLVVSGEIELLGGHAVLGSQRVPLTNVRGLLRLDTDRITIERLTGKYGEAEATSGRGEITHLTDRPEIYLAVKGNVTAPELAVIAARFAPPGVLPSGGAAGLSGLAGEAEATVLVSGPLSDFHDIRVDWELSARDIGFTDPRLPFPMSAISGKVRSISGGVAFEQLAGSLGTTALLVNGDIRDREKEGVVYDMNVAGRGDIKEWLSGLGNNTGAPLGEGLTAFTVNLAGPAEQLQVRGSLDLTQTGIVTASGWGKPQGLQAGLEFSARLTVNRVNVERVVLEIPPLNVLARGNFSLGEDRRFFANARIPAVVLRTLPTGLLGSTVSPTGGSAQAEVSIDGTMDNWRAANIRGRLMARNAAFKIERLDHPIDDVNLDLAFQDNRINVEQATVKIEDSRISGRGTIRGWRGIPVVEVILDSPGMDLDLLIPKGERSPMRTVLEVITGKTKLSGRATIRNAVYKGIDFEEIEAKLSGGDHKLIVDSINGTLPVGLLTAQVTLGLLQDKPIAVESSLVLDDVPVVPFLFAFGVKDPPVSGSLSMKASVRGETGTYSNLNGEADLIIEKGYFQKLSATSKIIGILNLPTLLSGKVDFSNKGMPFDCLHARVVVKNGIAHVERYVVDSPIMKMTAAGDYDIPNNSTNMVMAVSPLGSYEEFLKNLPVFGKLFVGERQELVTAFYEVKGPIEDPKVSLLPFKSVTSGVGAVAEMALGIMKNVFLLPKTLLTRSKKQISPCDAF